MIILHFFKSCYVIMYTYKLGRIFVSYYATFYTMSTGYVEGSCPPEFDDNNRKPIEACGDRSIIIIDGRTTKTNAQEIAKYACIVRGYVGYVLHHGDNIRDMKAIADYQSVI